MMDLLDQELGPGWMGRMEDEGFWERHPTIDSWTENGTTHYRLHRTENDDWFPNQCVVIGNGDGVEAIVREVDNDAVVLRLVTDYSSGTRSVWGIQARNREQRMALVVDEYGDIQGLVTLDDILEEIVGEFTPEGRGRSRTMRRLDDGCYLVDGSTSVRTLNRRLDWNLPYDEAHTIGGLLIEEMEVIPEGKCSISIGPHIMTALDIPDNFIHKILIKPDRT